MTAVGAAEPAESGVTQRARAFVDAHREEALTLGRELADLVTDSDAFVGALEDGFQRLADPEYEAGQHFIAPGLGPTYGVRSPLLLAAARAMRRGSKGTSPTLLFFVVERLLRHDRMEPRWFALHLLDETVAREPERTWQLLRRAARDAGDWITIDALAHPVAHGILAEPFRWAEIEQLTFSASPWERRLVGSTIATMPFADRVGGRTADWTHRALGVLGQLIGDAAPEVQKALAWAYRSVAMVDAEATAAALAREADQANELQDGHRAWVIRDAVAKLPADRQADIRRRLAGIRRAPGAPSTSRAAEVARRFAEGGLAPLPEDATLPSRYDTN